MIRKFRKSHKISIAELAKRTGLPLTYLVKIEMEEITPIREHFELIIETIAKPWTVDDEAGLILKGLAL